MRRGRVSSRRDGAARTDGPGETGEDRRDGREETEVGRRDGPLEIGELRRDGRGETEDKIGGPEETDGPCRTGRRDGWDLTD